MLIEYKICISFYIFKVFKVLSDKSLLKLYRNYDNNYVIILFIYSKERTVQLFYGNVLNMF